MSLNDITDDSKEKMSSFSVSAIKHFQRLRKLVLLARGKPFHSSPFLRKYLQINP